LEIPNYQTVAMRHCCDTAATTNLDDLLVSVLLDVGVLNWDDVVLLLLLLMLVVQVVGMELDRLAVGVVLRRRRRDERRVRMLELHLHVANVSLHRLQRRQRVALLEQILVGAVAAVQPQVEGLGQRLLGPLRAALDGAAAEKGHLRNIA